MRPPGFVVTAESDRLSACQALIIPAFLEPAGNIQSTVREDAVGTGALAADHRFHRDALFIDGTGLSGKLDHGVFAGESADAHHAG